MIVQGSSQAGLPTAASGPTKHRKSVTESRLSEKPQAVQSMEAAVEKAKETRKALAAQRVKQLREQMQIMRWFAIASPKTAAQQAARLGQDLKAAVRDYADPGAGLGMPGMKNGHTSLEIGAEDDGAAIREKLRAQLDVLKKAVEDEPLDKAFVVDVLALRSSIAGLVDVAQSGARNDLTARRNIRRAQHALQSVAAMLGQAPPPAPSTSILSILA